MAGARSTPISVFLTILPTEVNKPLTKFSEHLKGPLKGHDVVRLLEFFPPVFVTERFAEVFRNGGFTGATLTPVTGCS